MVHPIKEYSTKTKIPMKLIAEKAGTSAGYLSLVVTGKRRVSVHMARRLAKACENWVTKEQIAFWEPTE